MPIEKIAENVGIDKEDLELYGKYKAKFSNNVYGKIKNNKDGKLSAAARKKVMENYMIERVGDLYKRVYEGMINI